MLNAKAISYETDIITMIKRREKYVRLNVDVTSRDWLMK